jgi:hypothetical protein
MELDGRTSIEALLDQLCCQEMLHAYQFDADRWITHLFSVKLARQFHGTVLLDAT